MPSPIQSAQKTLNEIKEFICGEQGNKTSPTNDGNQLSPFALIFKLQECAPAFLEHPDAIDQLLEIAPQIESYRGKGSQIIGDGLPKILHCIFAVYQFSNHPDQHTDDSQPTQADLLTLKKIADFALTRVRGNGKVLRSRRIAQLRNNYWEILTDISDVFSLPEALALAIQIAPNIKASLTERRGAIDYLLNYLSFEDAPGDERTTTEVKSIITSIRENPPSRDILFQILDSEVNSGEIDEMSALFELEEYDDVNED